jgi:uncharacterized protein (DUF1810 family)
VVRLSQLRGLGRSPMADRYGIGSLAESRAYLAHPLLGPRLDLCARTVLESEAASLHAIFGSPDDMKFRSCATLFALAMGEGTTCFSARSIAGATADEMNERSLLLATKYDKRR